jgi:hypothetical protein
MFFLSRTSFFVLKVDFVLFTLGSDLSFEVNELLSGMLLGFVKGLVSFIPQKGEVGFQM